MENEGMSDKNGRIIRIMIVDDERLVQRALERTFRRNNLFECVISVARDAASVLGELEKREFDLIIADFKMPGMSGIDLLVKVKERFPETVRVLITGFSDINVAREARRRAKVHRYIEKPWDNEDLPRIIHELLLETNS